MLSRIIRERHGAPTAVHDARHPDHLATGLPDEFDHFIHGAAGRDDILTDKDPLSAADLFAAYVLGAMVRGIVVGAGVFLVTLLFAPSLLFMPYPL